MSLLGRGNWLDSGDGNCVSDNVHFRYYQRFNILKRTARQPVKNSVKALMEKLLQELMDEPRSWPFKIPVDPVDVPDYFDIIKHPMGMSRHSHFSPFELSLMLFFVDFSTIQQKISSNQYKTFDSFVDDVQLVFDNCRLYNPETSIYSKNARFLDQFFQGLLAQHLKQDK